MVRRMMPAAAVFLLMALSACGGDDDNPASSGSSLSSCYIVGNGVLFPLSGSFGNVMFLEVRKGDADGEPVTDAEVRVNGDPLVYRGESEYYAGEVSNVFPGTVVTVQVTRSGRSVAAQIQCPFALNNLTLLEGSWDTTDPHDHNTIIWENPPVAGDYIAVYLYEKVGSSTSLLQYASLSSFFEAVTFENDQLDYSDSIDSLSFEVYHVNVVDFAGAVEGSYFTAMTGRYVTCTVGKRETEGVARRSPAPGEIYFFTPEANKEAEGAPAPRPVPPPKRYLVTKVSG